MKNQNWKTSILRFLTAQTLSLFGSSLVQYAIVWHITLSTSSGTMLTLSTLCAFLPQILISLVAGVWIDRYDRRKLIMLSDSVIAAATLALAAAFYAGHRNTWLLFAVLMIRSAGTGIQTPAVNSILPQLVPQQQLMRINGINSTLSSVMMFLSPAVSGAVLSIAPLEATLLIDVFTAVIGVGITAAVRIRPLERSTEKFSISVTRGSHLQEIKAGFSYLKKNSFIRRLLLFQVLILFLISPSAFLTPLMVSRTFGREVWRLTASEMTYSMGMIAGGFLISFFGGFRRKMNTTLLAGAAYGLLILGLGMAPVFPIYLICNTLIGVTSPCYNTPITVTVQEKVQPDMQGRVFSFMQIASSCALPSGMILFGPLADRIPVQWLLIASGLTVLCACAYVCHRQYFYMQRDH